MWRCGVWYAATKCRGNILNPPPLFKNYLCTEDENAIFNRNLGYNINLHTTVDSSSSTSLSASQVDEIRFSLKFQLQFSWYNLQHFFNVRTLELLCLRSDESRGSLFLVLATFLLSIALYSYAWKFVYLLLILCLLDRASSWQLNRDQLDVTCFIISLFNAQHVLDVNTSILRSFRLICWVTSWVVLLRIDVCWCYVVVWLWWCGIRMQASACIRIPHHHSQTTT